MQIVGKTREIHHRSPLIHELVIERGQGANLSNWLGNKRVTKEYLWQRFNLRLPSDWHAFVMYLASISTLLFWFGLLMDFFLRGICMDERWNILFVAGRDCFLNSIWHASKECRQSKASNKKNLLSCSACHFEENIINILLFFQ